MSADCLFVLRNITNGDQLQCNISSMLIRFGYGVWFSPVNSLLQFSQLIINETDFYFAPTDAPNTTNVDLLVSHENHYVNGVCAEHPLKDRVLFIQELAGECIQFADSVEIYISEDNPYLPEYAAYEIECDMVADTLYKEYQCSVLPSHIIPSVALIIRESHV